MQLEFSDGSKLEVIRILGGPKVIAGTTRDVLSIEVDPETIPLEELREIISNASKTNRLFTKVPTGIGLEVRKQIAEGYNIPVSCRLETRRVLHPPGEMHPETYEDILVANIAQLTYGEYQSYLHGTWTPPEQI